jgi:hypothetical protein
MSVGVRIGGGQRAEDRDLLMASPGNAKYTRVAL